MLLCLIPKTTKKLVALFLIVAAAMDSTSLEICPRHGTPSWVTSNDFRPCDFVRHDSFYVCTPIGRPFLKYDLRDQFSEKGEDAIYHLENYERVCDEQKPPGMDSDQFKLMFFDFSLRGKPKKWFHSLSPCKKDTWDNCKKSFLIEFFFRELDFDNCSLSEVITFLQRMAKDPHTSTLNIAFTEHITNALIKAREEKLKLETSIPRKLEDGWDPMV